MSRGRWRGIYTPPGNLPVAQETGTGYIRTKYRIYPTSRPEVPVGADISATMSGVPLENFCELLVLVLRGNLAHQIYPASRPKVPAGADISATISGAPQEIICELLDLVLSCFRDGRIYPGALSDISGNSSGVALGNIWEQFP